MDGKYRLFYQRPDGTEFADYLFYITLNGLAVCPLVFSKEFVNNST